MRMRAVARAAPPCGPTMTVALNTTAPATRGGGDVVLDTADPLIEDDTKVHIERSGPKPAIEGSKARGEQIALYIFVIVPFAAFLGAIPFAWGWGLGWTD